VALLFLPFLCQFVDTKSIALKKKTSIKNSTNLGEFHDNSRRILRCNKLKLGPILETLSSSADQYLGSTTSYHLEFVVNEEVNVSLS
jgi:hypothetical protein